jgi:hypothetical protein
LKVVFTPAAEPYLGRTALLIFDNVIAVCLKESAAVASLTHVMEKNDLQWAACQLIPSGISLALSIRELIRQGYLYGALVLLRPLAERAITVLYLHRFPHKVTVWKSGWQHNKRPTLAQMFNEIGESEFPDIGPQITRSLNSWTHGDPASAMWNITNIHGAPVGHAPSKILDRPDISDKVAQDSAVWMSVLLAMIHAIFPEA